MQVVIALVKKAVKLLRSWASLLGGVFHLIASAIYLAANHGWL